MNEMQKMIAIAKKFGGTGTGGGSLPTGGEPHQALVTNANGETVWQPLTHYMSTTADGVGKEYQADYMDGMYALTLVSGSKEHEFIVGNKYDITIRFGGAYVEHYAGVEYKSIGDSHGLGNVALAGEGENTGERFLIAFVHPFPVLIPGEGFAEATVDSVHISGIYADPHPLPSRYMPCIISPNGTKHKLVVSDDGTLSTEVITDFKYE